MGKGLTFDSGGYNLKVGGMIELMKFDMGGAAAVLGAAQIIADLQPEGVEVCHHTYNENVHAHAHVCMYVYVHMYVLELPPENVQAFTKTLVP